MVNCIPFHIISYLERSCFSMDMYSIKTVSSDLVKASSVPHLLTHNERTRFAHELARDIDDSPSSVVTSHSAENITNMEGQNTVD